MHRKLARRRFPREALAEARTASRSQASAASAALRRSSDSTPAAGSVTTSSGPGTGIGRRPACRTPSLRSARARRCRCGSGRRTRRRAGSRTPARRPCFMPTNTHARKSALAASARAGPSPTTTLFPGGRGRGRPARFFSTATRPTYRKTGRRRSRARVRAGREERRVDAARPARRCCAKPRAAQALAHRRRGHITADDGAWKRREPGVGQRDRQAEARRHVLGKPRVVRGRERLADASGSALRAAMPSGPSVAMWIASGLETRRCVAPPRGPAATQAGSPDRSASGIVRKPSGVIKFDLVAPAARARAIVLPSVTTTPLTCGDQASVTIRMRI